MFLVRMSLACALFGFLLCVFMSNLVCHIGKTEQKSQNAVAEKIQEKKEKKEKVDRKCSNHYADLRWV